MRAVFADCTRELRRVIERQKLPLPQFIAINDGTPSVDDLVQLCRDTDVLMVEHTPVPPRVLDACPSIRAIVFMGTGAGTYIDLKDAKRRGILVLTTPGYGDRAVAEYAMAMMFAAVRNISRMDREIRAGKWVPMGGLQLMGRKLAVVGLGGIGTTLADMALALGMRVAGWNRTKRDHSSFEPELDKVLQEAEVISLHLALNIETRGLIDARRLHLPRRSFVLVNTARAQLVDEPAFLQALTDGQVGHAALDVFPDEPLPPTNPYIKYENVTLTAHAAYMTDDAYAELWLRTLRALESIERA